MTSTIRALFIDESPGDAALVVRLLAAAGFEVQSARVETPDALAAALAREPWDIAIADLWLRGWSGVHALALVAQRDPDLPFFFVSGTPGEEAAVAAMKSGARDYFRKGDLRRLVPSIRRELRDASSRRERRREEQRLAHLAYHDPLTDLPNRTLLHDRLGQAVRVSHRDAAPLALLVVDLDGFKAVNDTYGHHAGDRVLQLVASRMRAMLRDVDTVARLGGDEFAIVLPATDAAGAAMTARKVVEEIAAPCVFEQRPVSVRASVGIACFPEHGRSAEPLLQKADVAMYIAKGDASRIGIYTPRRDRQAHRRVSLLNDLKHALERRQFVLEYQPILHLRTGVVIGVEALARWNHPRLGPVKPEAFIDLAEQSGLVHSLTSLILDMAMADWAGTSTVPLTVAVNLSPRSLQDPALPQRMAELLETHGVPRSTLALEITENVLMADPARSLDSLTRLHAMGVRLVIDDFGTGYSSLSHLRRLPVDEIKIDRSFVAGLGSGQDEVIVRATIDLAHTLGLTATAEGLESEAGQTRLLALGCDAAQGPFVSPPAPAGETREWLSRQNLLGLM